MQNVRVYYRKFGRGKYISHLDMTRCMTRAMRRARIPAWYTEGFNPHCYMTFALPISLGFESNCETMDIRLTEEMPLDEVKERLNAALPEGIEVTAVGEPQMKASVITSAQYEIYVELEDCENPLHQFEHFLAQPWISVMKKTKRGEKEIDLKPQITLEHAESCGKGIKLQLVLPAGNEVTVNPVLVLDAYADYAKSRIAAFSVIRTEVYDEKHHVFA